MPLRIKLLVAVIVLVLAGLTVADVATYTSLRSFLLQRVDQQFADGAQVVLHAINDPQDPRPGPFGPSRALPPGTFGEVLDTSGKRIGGPVWLYESSGPMPDLPANIHRPADGPADPFTVGSRKGSASFRVSLQPILQQPGSVPVTLVVAVPLIDLQQTLSRLRLIEILVSLGALLLLGAISWWLVRRGLRPLEEIGTTAGAIAAGDLSQRVPDEDPRTEIGRLGISLNAMLAQIEKAFEERRASEDRLRRFLADASHELRTPLTSIRGYAELFRRGARQNETDLEKSMRRIEDESKRMGIMVEDLLLLARLDQDRPLELAPVDLGALAADAAQDARASHPDRSVGLQIEDGIRVLGDDARLRQVAANLLSNALVHTPPETAVSVRVAREGDGWAVLEVADRGSGLSPEEAERVFEPFYRSDPSRDRATGGAGLGLAIVAAIAEAHDGRVEVLETAGGGATFRVLLPAAPAIPPIPPS